MAVIEILEGGAASTVQDRGRPGYRSLGVPLSGPLDPLLLACANALAGNGADAAGMEMLGRGPRLRVVSGCVRLALAGAVQARRGRAEDALSPLPVWRSATLAEGELLDVGPIGAGPAYLAVAGGIPVPLELGSRATFARARLGGLEGRALKAGDRLAVAEAAPGMERAAPAPDLRGRGPVRVLPGPQDDLFAEEALRMLTSAEYRVTPDADRMGMRLAGPRLELRAAPPGGDFVSDGVAPGAIQVPPDGQPIVLLADCQTVGGYPKIATVIRADLPRLAHAVPGARLRFALVPRQAALAALRAQAAALAAWRAGLAPCGLDEGALYGANLISGVVFDAEDAQP